MRMVDGWWSATATTSLVRWPPQPVRWRCGGGAGPRVNDKRTDVETGERKRFASAIMAAWAKKSAQVAAVLPLLLPTSRSVSTRTTSVCW